MSNPELVQKSRLGTILIVIGAAIPAYPFYVFMSYYFSLDLVFACSYLGWWSDCGIYATIWLIAEGIGIILIIKGLMMRKNLKLLDKR